MRLTHVTRGEGHSSVGVAAHRAGEVLRDERANELYDFSRRRRDVQHSEILVPAGLRQPLPWATDRNHLWNTVEVAEGSRNARVATEIQMELPRDLPRDGRVLLARRFSQDMADRYRVAVDMSIHSSHGSGSDRSFHAHLLLTAREVSEDGLGRLAGLSLHGQDRSQSGLPVLSREYQAISGRWNLRSREAVDHLNTELLLGLDAIPAAPSRLDAEQSSVESLRREVRAAWQQVHASESAHRSVRERAAPGHDSAAGTDDDYHA